MRTDSGNEDLEDTAECVKQFRKEFNAYDQIVDVVSCWHSYFDYMYAKNGAGIYFDRYPKLGKTGLTPDFTMLFNKDYGIIADVAKSIDEIPQALESKAKQLKSYDGGLELKAGPTNWIKPDVTDIVLILHTTYSNRGAHKLFELQEAKEELGLDNNIIILEYDLSQAYAESAYIFKKLLYEKNKKFRDRSLPVDTQLERWLGKEMNPMKFPPDRFVVNKATYLFCNDEPCSIYMAARLWDRVFVSMLDSDQIEVWREGSSTQTVSIETTSNELCELIRNKISPGCRVRTNCMNKALQFLETAGKAKYSNGKWSISYGNLKVRRVAKSINRKKGGPQKSVESFHEMQEYAEILAELFCNGKTGKPIIIEDEEDKKAPQKSLFDF